MADNTEIEHLENSLDRFDMVSFDATIFDGMLFDNSLPFMVYKIYQHNGLIASYHMELIQLVNFSREMQIGYFKDNPFHNVVHVLDSMQGMHFMMKVGNVKKYLKQIDLFSCFTANLIHDYEHPGYSNAFVIRTKHPLAIRYSDFSVLENHHLAAAFTTMFDTGKKANIMENMSLEHQKEARKTIINAVLNTDLSKHFTLLTELKTKLGNNFPSESVEDRNLIVSVSLRIADAFKVVRERSLF